MKLRQTVELKSKLGHPITFEMSASADPHDSPASTPEVRMSLEALLGMQMKVLMAASAAGHLVVNHAGGVVEVPGSLEEMEWAVRDARARGLESPVDEEGGTDGR